MDKKKLSVIMPNYNDAAYVGEAIEAILNQSLKPDELIVIDDGSTDDSAAIIEAYAKKEPAMRFLKNEKNLGVCRTENRALEYASGDYLYSASSNDKVLPGFFEKSMRMLLQHPQAGACCTDFYFQFPNGTLLRDPKEPYSGQAEYLSPGELISRMSLHRFHVPHGCGVIYKRSGLMRAGGLLNELASSSDWFAVHVAAFREGICYLPEPLAVNRLISGSFSERQGRQLILQKKIYQYGRSLLNAPRYRDVSAAFQTSGAILAFFGKSRLDQLRMLLAHPGYWGRMVPLFLKRALVKW